MPPEPVSIFERAGIWCRATTDRMRGRAAEVKVVTEEDAVFAKNVAARDSNETVVPK